MLSSISFVALLLAGIANAAPAALSTPAVATPAITPAIVQPTAPSAVLSSVKPTATKAILVSGGGQHFNNITATVDNSTKPMLEQIFRIPPKLPIFSTCQTLIEDKAKQLAVNVQQATSGYISDPSLGTIHKNYKSGAIYCRTVQEGAHAIYGNIWLKFKAVGGDSGSFGYPLNDESGTTDNAGTAIRFNTFSKGNGIYWTPAHGAFIIYGDIYARWMSIGGTKSVVGYPITDETSSGTHGGRYNDFSNGMIYWHAGWSAVHEGPIPSSLQFTWSPINLEDVSGSTTITINSNGNARWQSHMHCSVPWPFNWAVAFVLSNIDGTALSFGQQGNVGPNWGFLGSANDSDVDKTVFNAEIRDNWRAFVAGTMWKATAKNSWDLGGLLNILEEAYKEIEKYWPAIAAVISVL